MGSKATYATTDLCDQHPGVSVVDSIFRDYGGAQAWSGRIVTVRVHEDNVLVRKTLEEPGAGKVLVIDGGGSLRCALLGDQIAAMAEKNGWAGILLFGAIRDSKSIAALSLGVKALGTNPLKSRKLSAGERDIPVTFAGVTFTPGAFLYADEDGVITAPGPLA